MSGEPRYGAMTIQAYGYAGALALIAIVPGANFLYSGHGGIAWLLLPLSFPIAVVVLLVSLVSAERQYRLNILVYIGFSLFMYTLFSLGCSVLGAWSISHTFGLPVSWLMMWELFFFPLTWPLLGAYLG